MPTLLGGGRVGKLGHDRQDVRGNWVDGSCGDRLQFWDPLILSAIFRYLWLGSSAGEGRGGKRGWVTTVMERELYTQSKDVRGRKRERSSQC